MKKILLLLVCFLFYGCPFYECFPVINGIVIDKATGKPISNAIIHLENSKSFSDINGRFKISESVCGKLSLIVLKNEYKPFKIKFSTSDDSKKYEIKSISKWVEYPTPFYPDALNHDYYLTGTWISQYSQDFQVKSDSIIVFLEEDNIGKEIENIKQELIKSKELNE